MTTIINSKQISETSVLDQIQALCVWKDSDSRWLGMNKTARDFFLINDLSSYIGKNDTEISWIEEPEKFIEQDKYIVQGNNAVYFETGYKVDGSKHFQIFKKSPLILENRIAGVNCFGFEISLENFQTLSRPLIMAGLKLSDFKIEIKDKKIKFVYDNIDFSKRQVQVLSLLLKGYTAAAIGHKLHLSMRTVEYYLKNLKEKLKSKNRKDIIKAAFEHGFIDLMFLEVI